MPQTVLIALVVVAAILIVLGRVTSITGAAEVLATPVRGSAEEIADGLRAVRAGGFTQIEVLLWPRTLAAMEAMAHLLEHLDAADRTAGWVTRRR